MFCKQKTAYEMRSSEWSSDVCSSDLLRCCPNNRVGRRCAVPPWPLRSRGADSRRPSAVLVEAHRSRGHRGAPAPRPGENRGRTHPIAAPCASRPTSCPREYARKSEEHTSELQSLMRISYAVFCLKK